MSSARESETRARGATANEAAVGGVQNSRKFDVFIDEGDVCDVSLETVPERPEIVDNVCVGSTVTFDVFYEGVVRDVSLDVVGARVGDAREGAMTDEAGGGGGRG